jgi:hypothetical protein
MKIEEFYDEKPIRAAILEAERLLGYAKFNLDKGKKGAVDNLLTKAMVELDNLLMNDNYLEWVSK